MRQKGETSSKFLADQVSEYAQDRCGEKTQDYRYQGNHWTVSLFHRDYGRSGLSDGW